MATWLDRAEQQLKAHSSTLHGVEVIARIVSDALIDPRSDLYVVLKTVARVVDTMIAGHEGKISSASVLEEFERISAMRTPGKHPNDVAIDSAVDKKFPVGDD